MKRVILIFILCVFSLWMSAQSQNQYKSKTQRRVRVTYMDNSNIRDANYFRQKIQLPKFDNVARDIVNEQILVANAKVSLSREDTEILFSIHTNGFPLVFPLVYESDPCLSLMLVSNDSTNLAVDRAYIVDTTQGGFDFLCDIYQLDSVKCFIDADGGHSKTIAIVSHYGTMHEFEIDGFIYSEIIKINKGKAEFKSNITIPVMKIERGRLEEENLSTN